MIKKNLWVFSLIFYVGISLACLVKADNQAGEQQQQQEQSSFSVAINQPQQFSTVKCLLLCVSKEPDSALESMAKNLKFDLEFTDQLRVEVKRAARFLDPAVTQKLFNQGTSLCLYLKKQAESKKKKETKVLVKLIDAISQAAVFEKEYTVAEKNRVHDLHAISADLIPVLTGAPGITLSSLAFCKQLSSRHKVICVADYACLQEKTIVSAKSINVAPSWHSYDPVLFYSQFTRTNSRLMSVDFKGKHRIVCSYDGLNMQPSFSKDGRQVVLCLSGVNGNSELYCYDQRLCHKLQKRVYVPLTTNGGNNVSPALLPDGNVIFCSDFETNYPQIYYLDAPKKEVYRITSGKGHCAAPAYNEKNNSIVFMRLVNGVFQLFSTGLDQGKRAERQLTFKGLDKLDPTWSPCGRYVAFTLECVDPKNHKKTPQIAILNTLSGKIRVLTNSKEPKSFAAWVGMPYFRG